MSRERAPITPQVLTWARERAYISLDDMRAKGFRDIEAWERQESAPTYPQLERLAEALKTPVAVFFFPEPPEVPPIRESFRTLPDAQYEALPSAMHFLLRKAKAFQMNLEELHDGKNPAEDYILRDLRFDLGADIAAMARKVREYLGVTLEEQMGWESSGEAFEAWRAVLERHGVAVFKDAFKMKVDKRDLYSGFCLYDAAFPLIYVNNSAKTRESFTLFHELAHLLFETSGVDNPEDHFTGQWLESDKQIEVTCNAFAAEFLLPQKRFAAEVRGLPRTEETAEQLASRYHVSREMIFRRFLDSGEITQEAYEEAADRWRGQAGSGEGGNYYWNKVTYLGMEYLRLAFSHFHQGRISEPRLADYLDTKVKNLSDLEDHFTQKAVKDMA